MGEVVISIFHSVLKKKIIILKMPNSQHLPPQKFIDLDIIVSSCNNLIHTSIHAVKPHPYFNPCHKTSPTFLDNNKYNI
jgi:hypothetical protein